MDHAPHAPAHATPGGGARRVSRRGLLLGGVAVVLAGGGGVAVGALRPLSREQPTGRPPVELAAALSAERALIAAIDATTGGATAVRSALRQIRADHEAHQGALQAAVGAYPQPPLHPGPSSGPAVAALDVPGLRSAEQHASARAAKQAAALTGRNAALLASIAACEASHAELFG